jgi:hypothetical protein
MFLGSRFRKQAMVVTLSTLGVLFYGANVLAESAAPQSESPSESASEDKPLPISANLSLTAGFKPEYFEGEDKGRYGLLSGSLGYQLHDRLSLGLSQGYLGLYKTEEVTYSATDPSLTAAIALFATSETNPVSVGLTLGFRPGLSVQSREQGLRGSASQVLSISKKVGIVHWRTFLLGKKMSYRYTLDELGRPRTSHAFGAGIGASMPLIAGVSADASHTRQEVHRYSGDPVTTISNSISLSAAPTEQTSVSIGLSHSNSALAPNGDENNQFELYKVNQTEGFVSLSYGI